LDDARWLIAADLLTRLAADGAEVRTGRGRPARDTQTGDAGSAVRAALAQVITPGDASGDEPSPIGGAGLPAQVVALADEMEARGALRLAWATLALVPQAFADVPTGTLGLALAQRARIARKVGDLEVASDLYADAARIGRATRDAALVARATVGRGVVARVRGNYPEARACFEAGARAAARAGLRDLEGHARHGLLVAAAAARDFDAALRHGWAALSLVAGDPVREAELLINLAAVSSDAGAPASAVHAYLAAADRAREARVRLPALGGAALAAAQAGDVGLLDRITRALRAELPIAGLPYEVAQANTLLARAWGEAARLGTSPTVAAQWSREFAAAARDAATRFGFHELAHQIDELDASHGLIESPAGRRAATPRPSSARRGPSAPAGPVQTSDGDVIRTRGARAVVAALARFPIGREFELGQALASGRSA
jgi:tetratricopeptide (TPR) repeat protein